MWGSAECFGPVGGEPFAVLGVEAVAERVAHYLVGHHPGMPRLGETQEALVAAGGFVDALHDGIFAARSSLLRNRLRLNPLSQDPGS